MGGERGRERERGGREGERERERERKRERERQRDAFIQRQAMDQCLNAFEIKNSSLLCTSGNTKFCQ